MLSPVCLSVRLSVYALSIGTAISSNFFCVTLHFWEATTAKRIVSEGIVACALKVDFKDI